MSGLNLRLRAHAYLFGFVQGDGYMSRDPEHPSKGRLVITLDERDAHVLRAFVRLFPESTLRQSGLRGQTWTMYRKPFRDQIERLGIPYGAKSHVIEPPSVPYAQADYWRGLIDSDGSVGLTGAGLPYLALATSSERLARAFETYLESITGKPKRTNRNERDGVFNVMVMREDAVRVIKTLYYEGCLALKRKVANAGRAAKWLRPKGMRRSGGGPADRA